MPPRRRRTRSRAADEPPKTRRKKKTHARRRRGRSYVRRNPLFGPQTATANPFSIYAQHSVPLAAPKNVSLSEVFPMPASWGLAGTSLGANASTIVPASSLPRDWLAVAAQSPNPAAYLRALGLVGTQYRQAGMMVRVARAHRNQLLRQQQRQSIINMYNSGTIGGAPAANSGPQGVNKASFFGDLWDDIKDVALPVADIAANIF